MVIHVDNKHFFEECNRANMSPLNNAFSRTGTGSTLVAGIKKNLRSNVIFSPMADAELRHQLKEKIENVADRAFEAVWAFIKMALYDEFGFKKYDIKKLEDKTDEYYLSIKNGAVSSEAFWNEFRIKHRIDEKQLLKMGNDFKTLPFFADTGRVSRYHVVNVKKATEARKKGMMDGVKRVFDSIMVFALKALNDLYKFGNKAMKGKPGRMARIIKRIEGYIESIAKGVITPLEMMECLHVELQIDFKLLDEAKANGKTFCIYG